MKYSEIKQIILFCDDIGEEWRDVLSEIQEEVDDFTVGNYRFINIDEIDNVQIEELKSDPYILGNFNSWFISNVTGIPEEMIEASQRADLYEVIGNHIIYENHIEEFQRQYSNDDGYGHHFSSYDGNTLEDLCNLGYYVFRVN